jgi:F0F1-type ATP synthase assembly protein I
MIRALPRLRLPNWASLAASALLVATLVAVILDVVLWAGQRFQPPPVSFIQGQAIHAVEIFYAVAYAAMGWLLASRLPRNVLGWLFLLLGLSMALQMTSAFLVQEAHQVFRPLDPLLLLFAWLSSTAHIPFTVTLLAVVFVRFPDGKPLTPRWRGVGLMTGTGAILASIGVGLDPRGLMWFPSLPNPFAAPSATMPLLNGLLLTGVALMATGTLVAAISMFVRYRRADETQRAQLRWIAFAVALLAGGGLPFIIGRYALEMDYRSGELLLCLALASGCFLPVAAAIAILRHRLYDIDLIINRALVYIPLTAIVGGLYTGGVAFGQRVFVAVTGDRSDAAIVITTLVIASLFTHIRNALQSVVDSRFRPGRATAIELPPLIPHDELKARLANIEERIAALEVEAPTRHA